ncbi:MAG: glycosyltransferase family 2 protein [Akkermansia sp.]|nr:glycosyltransferase family 2 protein [Akkermansia sp.]
MTPETLYIVMPCFNEAACIETTIVAVSKKLDTLISAGTISCESAMLFADDGSKDTTWNIISEHHKNNKLVKACRLAGNRGKEKALFAGLMEAKTHADIVICMDADLQHDINAIDEFLALRNQGYELIYGVKKSRGRESFFRKSTAVAFYWIAQKLGSPISQGHSDYSLMTKQVLEALSEYGESNMMFRTMLKQLGFNQCPLYFEVKNREQGESKMSLGSLLRLSIDAITSYSVTPLRFISGMGLLIFLASLAMIAWVAYDYFKLGTPNGWATVVCSLWFLGGIGMISMGVAGEYIGKIYLESKRRPRYFIKSRLQ